MKRAMMVAGVAFLAMAGSSSTAWADGMSDPMKAREACDKRGEGKSVEALKKCCSNLILVGDIKEQRKLEAQCVKGKAEAVTKKK